MRRAANFVDGCSAASPSLDGEIVLRSPADTADELGVCGWSMAEVDRAVAAAQRAWPAWRRQSSAQRAAFLRGFQQRLRHHAAAIATSIAREVGKPLWEAEAEVKATLGKIDLTLDEGMNWVRPQALADLPGEIRYRPHGVLAVLGPFNFPAHLPTGHIAPALLLGNTVVCKPSERAPWTSELLARCWAEAELPAGVFNLVQGDAQVARRLTEHAGIDGILFTGSARVGKQILRAQADCPGRLVALEMGGKNAAIVLDDCDLERTVRQVAFGAYATAGQRCSATSRLYVTAGVREELIERLAQAAERLVVGYPFDAGVFMGPLISEEARQKALALLSDAERQGAHAVVAAGPATVQGRHGWYVRPSLHVLPTLDAPIEGYGDQELFAPDIAIYPIDELDQAIDAVNRSRYGLVASLFTASRSTFEHAAEELRVGVLHHNRSTAGASSRLPFGGLRDSGNHRPAGIAAAASCAYPLGIWHAAETPEMPSWPGLWQT